MEWNWCWNGNDVTPFLLYESSGDSEEVKSDVHHHHHEDHDGVIDDQYESMLFQDDNYVVDDDAQSCSYDHSSYINTSYGDSHDQSQSLAYDDHSDIHDDDDGDDDDDGNKKNWGESKLMDPCKQQKISHKFCGDSSNQREIDRKFWEACLAS